MCESTRAGAFLFSLLEQCDFADVFFAVSWYKHLRFEQFLSSVLLFAAGGLEDVVDGGLGAVSVEAEVCAPDVQSALSECFGDEDKHEGVVSVLGEYRRSAYDDGFVQDVALFQSVLDLIGDDARVGVRVDGGDVGQCTPHFK